MARDKFESALEKGFGFCDVVLGWDSNDQLYDNTTLTGWHTAYPDATARVLPETMRLIPFENDLPFFLAEFDGYAEAACPRGVARRTSPRRLFAQTRLPRNGRAGARIAWQAMMQPSISRCGSSSMIVRSLKVPGSSSLPLQTTS